MNNYTLEYLSEEFSKHAEEYVNADHYTPGAFNLPLALKTIVDGLIQALDG
jgi:hypothetical protein